jgi:hypothetical protein
VSEGLNSGILFYVNRDYLPENAVIVNAVFFNADDLPVADYLPVLFRYYSVTPNQFVFMNIDKFIGKSINGKVIKGSMDFANYIIEYGVALIPGLPFHIDNYVRLSYAISEGDIIDGIKLLGKFISDLK